MLRELRAEDADRVATLFEETFGEDRLVDATEVRSWLDNEELKPEWLRVLELDGTVVGYGDILIAADVALDVAAPGHWDAFFGWAEEEARAADVTRVRVVAPEGHELAAFAEARGYSLFRSSYTMEIDLPEALPTPEPPTGLSVRPYTATDEATLIEALNDAFVDDPFWSGVTPPNFREFYLRARGFDPALWLLAWDGDRLAAFALAYSERGGDTTLGWVGTLGVRAPWRRRGIGEALLRAAFSELHARGLRRVGLGVDTQNATGAVRLYERVGMRPVRRADNWVIDL